LGHRCSPGPSAISSYCNLSALQHQPAGYACEENRSQSYGAHPANGLRGPAGRNGTGVDRANRRHASPARSRTAQRQCTKNEHVDRPQERPRSQRDQDEKAVGRQESRQCGRPRAEGRDQCGDGRRKPVAKQVGNRKRGIEAQRTRSDGMPE